MGADSSDRKILLNLLGNEFAERYRRGERPELEEYTNSHPELAEEIREYFPTMVEQVNDARDQAEERPSWESIPELERPG